MNTKNICIYNVLTKLGLSGAEDNMPMAWIERFFVKTFLRWREKNETEPYRAAYAEEIIDIDSKIHKTLVTMSD